MSTDQKRTQLYFALSGIAKSGCVKPSEAPDGERLAAFLDGKLSGSQIAATKSHLAKCSVCYQGFAAFESALSGIRTTDNTASTETKSNSLLDTLKSHWASLSTGLGGGIAVAVFAFVFITSPALDLTTNLRGDLQGMAPYAYWPDSSDEQNKSINTRLDIPTETVALINRGFTEGLQILAPDRQHGISEAPETCINNSDLSLCTQQQRWAYNVGLWLVLTETFCQGPNSNTNNSPINLESLSERLEDLLRNSKSSLLVNIDSTTAQSLCQDRQTIVTDLGLSF